MRQVPRPLAFALIILCVLLGAGGGVLVGGRLAPGDPVPPPSPPATATVAAVAPPATAAAQPSPSMSASPAPPPRATPTVAPPPVAAAPCVARSSAASPAPDAPNAIAAGPLGLTATFATIGIDLPFLGDDNGNAVAGVAFRAVGAADWRAALPLWRVGEAKAGQPRAFYGSVLLLDAGTCYEVRVTLDDPDGVRGERAIGGVIATRADDLPAAEALSPTHFLAPAGRDDGDGSAMRPWRTLDQALGEAPSGAVVRVAPGSYAPPTVARKEPITLVAARPAVGDDREPTNAGARSVIEPQSFTLPGTGAWVRTTLTGPATGEGFAVWAWSGGPAGGGATRLTIAADRRATPQRVAYWARKNGTVGGYTLGTPAGWAEVLYRNETYNYGFAAFGSDLYLRLPGDRDPNGFVVAAYAAPEGGKDGRWDVDAPGVRVSGFEFRSVDLRYNPGASNGVVDRNLFLLAGLIYRGDGGTPSRYSGDQLVERNRFVDTGTWSADPAWPAIPWNFLKAAIRLNGAETPWTRVGAEAETTAIAGRGGAHRLVVRRNTIDGFFNGIGGYNEGFDRYAQQDTDLYENLLRHIADDSFEPEQQGINWRIWGNRLEYVSTALSTGPLAYGPVYFFRNEVWRLGASGVGADGRGNRGVGVVGFKYSGNSAPAARLFVVNNTFWTDEPGADGGNQYAGGGPNSERFYLRNNIFRMTRYAFAAPGNSPGTADRWDEDYDYFATTAADRGISYAGNRTTVAAYRAASGQGARTNRAGDFRTEPGLVNPAAGDLALAADSPLIDAGVPVPNICDRPGVDYRGAAPDLGAREGP